MAVAINLTGVGSSGGAAPTPTTPSAPSILSVSIIDTTPDTSGNPQKQITVQYTPPTPLGTFNGIDIWLDAPDSSLGLAKADGSQAADGNTPAVGAFAPTFETFFPYVQNNYQVSFVVPAPTVQQLWRVYITAASANVKVPPVEYSLPNASPSFQLTVLPPATIASGREYAPLVQAATLNTGAGWSVNPILTKSESGDQFFQYSLTWVWPTNDSSFATLGGVNIVLQNNTAGTQVYVGDVLVTAQAVDISAPVTVLPGTTSYTAYLLSFDVRGNSNTLVPGVTPSVTFSVTRLTGVAGQEYTHLVTSDGTHAFVVCTSVVTSSGTQETQVDGYWSNILPGAAGYDSAFGGAEIVIDKGDGKGPVYAAVKGTLSPIEAFVLSPASAQTWAIYIRSIDINGKANTITPKIVISGGGGAGAAFAPVVSSGVLTSCQQLNGGSGYSSGVTAVLQDSGGNAIAGVSLTPVLSGGAISSITVGSGGSGIVATPQAICSVGNSSGTLNLAKAATTSFSTQFAVVAGAFTVSALNANIITTGTLKVGNNGSGVPIELDIYDHVGNLIGWIGDDFANSGYVGGWFKQLRVGGASPSASPIVADSSGNVTITGAPFTLSFGGSTTTINNTSATYGVQAVLAKNNSSPSWDVAHTDQGFTIRAKDQSTYIALFTANGSGSSEAVTFRVSGSDGSGYNKNVTLATGGANTPFVSVANASYAAKVGYDGLYVQTSGLLTLAALTGDGGSGGNGGYLALYDSGGSLAFSFDASTTYTATSATAGSQTLPGAPAGFLIVSIGGSSRKIPYYNL